LYKLFRLEKGNADSTRGPDDFHFVSLNMKRTVDNILISMLHYTFINQSHLHTNLVVSDRIAQLNVVPNA